MSLVANDLVEVSYKDVPFFFDEGKRKFKCKIRLDGSHYIAVPMFQVKYFGKGGRKPQTAKDIYFDDLFLKAMQKRLRKKKLFMFIKDEMIKEFPYEINLDKYIEERIKKSINNLHKRKSRFKRKAIFNSHLWNYFVTLTYDDKLHNEVTFRNKLRRCLSNLSTKRGWKYMCVFERSPSGRLHVHGIFHVPNGEMIGKLSEVNDYDTVHNKKQTSIENSFFKASFGKNDFKPMSAASLEYFEDYTLKYINKSKERVVYSRGLTSEIIKEISEDDIALVIDDFFISFILHDDVIDWKKDIAKYKDTKQISMWDYMCNPPN